MMNVNEDGELVIISLKITVMRSTITIGALREDTTLKYDLLANLKSVL